MPSKAAINAQLDLLHLLISTEGLDVDVTFKRHFD
jgi:hypothetical protein